MTGHRQVLCGEAPLNRFMNLVAMQMILEGIRPSKPEEATALGFTDGLWGIVERCWSADRNTRPDVKTVLSHLTHAAWAWDGRLRGSILPTRTQGATDDRTSTTDNQTSTTDNQISTTRTTVVSDNGGGDDDSKNEDVRDDIGIFDIFRQWWERRRQPKRGRPRR